MIHLKQNLIDKINLVPNNLVLGWFISLICILAVGLSSNHLKAETLCEAKEALTAEDCVASGEWHFALGVGVGIRTNPLNNSDHIPLVLLPKISYYGDNLFIENLDIGYNLFDSDNNQINLVATPNYDSVFFNRWDPSNIFVDINTGNTSQVSADISQEDYQTQIDPEEVSKRKFSYLGGFEYSHQWKKSQIQIALLSDISDVHSGSEARLAYQYKVNDYFSATTGFTWKDQKLTDYYYGIEENEIIDNRGSYKAKSSFSPFIRFSLNTSKNKESWRISFELKKLDSSINQSPLLKEDKVITFFIGKYFDWDN